MNFLAHIALSGKNPELIMGNFCGDHIKGKLDSDRNKARPKGVLKGVRLHRFIDHFTDTDPTVKTMIRELLPLYGRAASIATDISFDHFLAKNFREFHGEDLRDFVTGFYRVFAGFSYLVPDSMKPLAGALVENDWLFKYREWETVERTYRSMSRRYPFIADLGNPPEPFHRELARYEQYFYEFYPRLQAASAAFLEELEAV